MFPLCEIGELLDISVQHSLNHIDYNLEKFGLVLKKV